MSQIDVNTKESGASTTGTYGNASLDGTNLGIGLKGVTSSNIVWKLAYEETDFDTLNLTSTTSNKIKADLDTEAVSLSIGYRFQLKKIIKKIKPVFQAGFFLSF